MKVTAQEEYGLRCMMSVAGSSPDRPLTVHEIGTREGLSGPYVAKLMNLLRDAGLVDSVRGRSGGYYIARAPDKVNISEILAALGGHIFEDHYCDRFPGEVDACVHTTECSIRSLWGTLEGLVEQVLRRTTLADLMKSELSVHANLTRREAEHQRRKLPVLPAEPEAERLPIGEER
jgi:Rrf2 family protein